MAEVTGVWDCSLLLLLACGQTCYLAFMLLLSCGQTAGLEEMRGVLVEWIVDAVEEARCEQMRAARCERMRAAR